MNLAQKIRAFRAEKGWTQSDLARFSGVGKSSIQLYESGNGNITNSNLKKLAAAFDKTLADFDDDLSVSPVRKLSVSPVRKSSVSRADLQNQARNLSVSRINSQTSLNCNENVIILDCNEDERKQINRDTIYIRALSSAVGAGESVDIDGVEVYDSELLVPFSRALFKLPPHDDRVRCMRVDGYSMIPMLYPDSWVIADVTARFEGDGLYIINMNGNFMVKLLQRAPNGDLDVISVNKEYRSYHIGSGDDTQIIVVGKVLRCVI